MGLPIKFSAHWMKKLTLCRLSYCSNCLHCLVVVELFLTTRSLPLTKKFTASSSVHLGPVGRGGHDIACILVISFTVLQLTLGETSSKKLYLSIPHATQVPPTTVVNLEAEGGQLMHSSLVLLVYQPFHLGVPH